MMKGERRHPRRGSVWGFWGPNKASMNPFELPLCSMRGAFVWQEGRPSRVLDETEKMEQGQRSWKMTREKRVSKEIDEGKVMK